MKERCVGLFDMSTEHFMHVLKKEGCFFAMNSRHATTAMYCIIIIIIQWHILLNIIFVSPPPLYMITIMSCIRYLFGVSVFVQRRRDSMTIWWESELLLFPHALLFPVTYGTLKMQALLCDNLYDDVISILIPLYLRFLRRKIGT